MNRNVSMMFCGAAALGQLSRHWLQWLTLVFVMLLSSSSILAEENQEVQLYYFTNHGCPPCRQVAPEIDTLKREGYKVSTIVLSENPQWADRFQVQRVPTVIMVVNQRIVGRHEGLISAQTLREWFGVMGVDQPTAASKSDRAGLGLVRGRGQSGASRAVNDNSQPVAATTSTMHKGTPNPANKTEYQALQATVRLKVQDSQGASYATGTVIHCHQGEWLIMTCGHAFREAGYQGRITGEYNFANGPIRSANAELISYDAGPRDIALVAMRTGENIQPMSLASADHPPSTNQSVFSLGCDQGADPTIRHTKIKHKALYDGATKFVIFGRPTIGRSGGGLFNESGELVGVCNAAMVDSDEGVYTSLETVYWQLAQANLTHLFVDPAERRNQPRLASVESDSQLVSNASAPLAKNSAPQSTHLANHDLAAQNLQPIKRDLAQGERGNLEDRANSERDRRPIERLITARNNRNSNLTENQSVSSESVDARGQQRLVRWNEQQPTERAEVSLADDQEVIIIVRSKSDSRIGQSITINDPSAELLDYLDRMKGTKSEPQQLEMARWRQLD